MFGDPDGRKVTGYFALKYPEIVQGDIREGLGRHSEILGKNGGRRMREPIRHQQGVELACIAIIEADDEFASIRAEPLQGMGVAGREIPNVSLFHVGDIRLAHGIEDSDAAVAISHERPLGRLVPVQFAKTPGAQPHIDA